MHYLLLVIVALTLLACPSKPQRRAPTVMEKSDDAKTAPSSAERTGLYLALQHKDMGYQPVVLRIANGLVTALATEKVYSSDVVFAPTEQELSKSKNNLEGDIHLLLAFTEGVDSYCVATPLAKVLQWVKLAKGASHPTIKSRLGQAQPINISSSKGKLEEEGDTWQCTR